MNTHYRRLVSAAFAFACVAIPTLATTACQEQQIPPVDQNVSDLNQTDENPRYDDGTWK